MPPAPLKKKVPLQFPAWLVVQEDTLADNLFQQSQLALDRSLVTIALPFVLYFCFVSSPLVPVSVHPVLEERPGPPEKKSPGCQKRSIAYLLRRRTRFPMLAKGPGRVCLIKNCFSRQNKDQLVLMVTNIYHQF